MTVVAPLDTETWAEAIEITPLADSLNPLALAPRLASLAQTHIAGADDQVALQVAGLQTQVNLGRALTDGQEVLDGPEPRVGFAPIAPPARAVTQAAGELAALRAVRDSEVAAESVGLNPLAIKTMAFAVSAVCAGAAGGLFAPLSGFVTPHTFG